MRASSSPSVARRVCDSTTKSSTRSRRTWDSAIERNSSANCGNRSPERLERLEVAHLPRERIGQRGELLAFHFPQGELDIARLPPLRFFGEVVGEADGRIDGVTGREVHDALLHVGNRPAFAQDELVGLGILDLAVLA